MPRFVILEHDHPMLHWDLMLEDGPALRTWRLTAVPELGKIIPAEPSFEHRKVYLDFEGPVSGNRGTVRRWDEGEYHPPLTVTTGSEVGIFLHGKRMRGLVTLRVEDQGMVFFWQGETVDAD
jgi:hypothetical protein